MTLTEEERIEGSHLISRFMDGKWYPKSKSLFARYSEAYEFNDKVGFGIDQLKFHSSWDWIHTVIDKVNGLGKEYNLTIFKTYLVLTVEKGGKVYKDFSFAHSEYITNDQTGKEAAFKLLVKFIKWYNEHVLSVNLKPTI